MSQNLVLLPDEMVQRIIEALNDINAIVNFVSSSRGRRLPQTTFIQLLQSQFDRNLVKLPAPVKAVLSTMPKLNSLKVTRSFWSNYMASLSKAGLLDGTFAEAWDVAYKSNVEYYQKCEAQGKEELSVAEQPQPRELYAHIHHIPSKAHKDVVYHFYCIIHQKLSLRTIEAFDMIYDGKGQRTSVPTRCGRLVRCDTEAFMDLLDNLLPRSQKRPRD